ncbi:MAG: hypothetical protein CME65_01210 [Halobacteriovoraceae bacterium]|nr:hypothetical protein [Halobacteriovoraceae bacterium]|tara:strand:+ start:1126 stop:2028 length:903 start_codon:yes stop_codon:yes gene_type:complete
MRVQYFGLFVLILFAFKAEATYLFAENKFESNRNWQEFSGDERLNVRNLLVYLKRSSTGAKLIELAKRKAEEQGQSILDIIKAGRGSLTDTTLVRRFTTGNPEDIEYEMKSVVFINENHNQYDALMDLAHELTHFVFREEFNPYTKNFTLAEFIHSTIEGTGGEVQAFMMECKVHFELFPSKTPRGNCQNVVDGETGHLSKHKTVRRFYQVGAYFESFKKMLDRHGIQESFPLVTEENASFVSSAYGIPYPVAAFEEYLTVINKVCENDRKRLGYMQQRSPASASKFQVGYQQRCKGFVD